MLNIPFTFYARQDIIGADRQYAQNYERGDVIRYSKGSKPLGIEAGEYARVARTEPENKIVTVTRKSGEELSYDPRRLQGVTVYRDIERTFAEGDRVQVTARITSKSWRIVNWGRWSRSTVAET